MDENEDDIEIAADEEEGEEHADARIQKLREEISRLRNEKQEYMDGWQRSKADYVNALKRFEEEKKRERGRGVREAAERLLPALDALERAKEHQSSLKLRPASGEGADGIWAIMRQLESAFAGLGLEPVGAVGELFDPARHEALGQDPTDVCEIDDTVSAVLEKGWRLGDALIRPAKVRVAHFEG